MRKVALGAAAALLGISAGCGSAGLAGDYRWEAKVPERVAAGADFTFTVRTFRREAEGPVEETGVPFEYAVAWPGGSTAPLRHQGYSGEEERVRARVLPGTARLLVYAPDEKGLSARVAQAEFLVE